MRAFARLARLKRDRAPRPGEAGSVALEFALVYPVLIIMLLGMVVLFFYVTTYMNVIRVAQTLADLVSRQPAAVTGGQSGNLITLMEASAAVLYPSSTNGQTMTLTVTSVVPDGKGGAMVAWSCQLPVTVKGSAYTGTLVASPGYPIGAGFTLPSPVNNVGLLTYNTSVIAAQISLPYVAAFTSQPWANILPVSPSLAYTAYMAPRTVSSVLLTNNTCAGN